MRRWLHSSYRRPVQSDPALPVIRELGNGPPPLVFPSEVDDILHVVVGVGVALLIVLTVDQWFWGAFLSESLF